jgi:hypothetical protein
VPDILFIVFGFIIIALCIIALIVLFIKKEYGSFLAILIFFFSGNLLSDKLNKLDLPDTIKRGLVFYIMFSFSVLMVDVNLRNKEILENKKTIIVHLKEGIDIPVNNYHYLGDNSHFLFFIDAKNIPVIVPKEHVLYYKEGVQQFNLLKLLIKKPFDIKSKP